MAVNHSLIVDIGMSEGNDTAFYLAKGFQVVGVEADTTLQPHLTARFADEITAGRLLVLHRAASETSGDYVTFYHNSTEQGHSSLDRQGRSVGVAEYRVGTIDWSGLRAVAGVPYYLKLDIEGAEPGFLRSMLNAGDIPLYISAEVQTFQPIELFHRIGYKRFRLINQTLLGGVTLPDPPLEGGYVERPDPFHWSGPFGRELAGNRWFSFEEIRAIYGVLHELWGYGMLVSGWMDCHATLEEPDAA